MATKKAAQMVRFNAVIMWAFMNKTNEMSGKYQFDACNLSPKSVEALKSIGIDARLNPNHPEKGHFHHC